MKKVVLLPVLVLASALVLAGCDTSPTSTVSESGSEGASSSVGEETGSGSEGASSSVGEGTGSGSASESIPDSEPDEYTKLADIEVADETTSRGVYMGKTDLVRSNKKAYNYLWLADGDAAGVVYTVSEDLFDSSWVAGETVLEVTGKVVEYNEFLQFSNITSLTAVDDSSVTPGKAIELTGQDVTIEDVHHLYSIKDAEVASVAGSGEFKITLGGTTYNVRLDNRDIADGPIWDVKAGDKVTMTSFLSAYKGTMQFITATDVTVTPGEEEEPDPEPEEVKYLDEILTLAKDEIYTGRAVYMGMTDLNKQYNSHNGVYVADGENWYLLYQVSGDLIPENLVSGQTVLEWDGTVADFKNTKESKVTALRTVTDAEVTAGTWDRLAEDYAPAVEDINRGVVLENAYVVNVSVGNYNNTTLTLKASEEGTKTFTVYLDSRYTDVTVPAIADLKVGDTLSGKTFVGENTNDGSIQFIYMIDPVRTPGEGGEDPEPEPTGTTIAELYEMEPGTEATISGVIVGIWEQGIVIDDNTGTIYRYDNQSETLGFEVGDYVTVSGTIGEFNGARQFNYSSDIAAAEGTAPTLTTTTPTEWTGADMDAFAPSSRSPLVKIAGTVDSLGQHNNVTVPGAEKTLSLFLSETISATLEVGRSYDFTGYALYISSGRYVNVLITSAKEISVSAPTAIEVTSPVLEIMVGRTAQLSVSYEPAICEKGVTWSSSDEKIATVDEDGIVTAIAEGEVTITATSTADQSVKGDIALTVIAAPEATLAGTLDFSSLTGKGAELSASELQSTMASCMESETALSLTVTSTTKFYDGNGAGGYLANTPGLIKAGTGSEKGVIAATISASVVRIEMDCAKWNDSASDTISLNGVTYDAPAYDSEAAEWGTLTWDFAEGTTDFNVETNKRVFIKAIRLYVAA